MAYHELYVAFLYYFNIEKDYFECHEVMEELWLEERRDPFWQGLLQVAVGLYHHENDNISGAIKLFSQSLEKLCNQENRPCGIQLSDVIERTKTNLHHLEANEVERCEPFLIEILDADLALRVTQFVPHLHE